MAEVALGSTYSGNWGYTPNFSTTSSTSPTTTTGSAGGATTSAGLLAVSGLINAYGASQAAKASGYLQQASYAIQATENMRLAGIRADKEIEYAEIQAARKQKQVEMESLNFKIQANSLLRSLNKANATTRARAYANGISASSGSAMAMQNENVRNVYRDVQVTELNALASRVFGFEDATNILRAGYDQAYYNREAAIGGTNVALKGGGFAAQTGGLLANQYLIEGATRFAQTFPSDYFKQKALNLFNG